MNRLFLILCTVSMLFSCNDTTPEEMNEAAAPQGSRQFYQLKTYTFASDEQVALTDAYLKDAFVPAMKRLGYGPIGVFKSYLTDTDTVRKTRVLIPLQSLDEVLVYEAALAEDDAYKAVGEAYINAPHDQPPYRRIESTLLRAFVDMPTMYTPSFEGARSERVYELRSYESATEADYWNKVDMFNAGGEIKLFDRLGFNAVFYGEVVSGSRMPNLMYMTTFPDRPTRDTLWEAFFSSPEWTELKAMEKYKNNVSKADIIFLYPATYSDY